MNELNIIVIFVDFLFFWFLIFDEIFFYVVIVKMYFVVKLNEINCSVL